jgi:uncharacterized protein
MARKKAQKKQETALVPHKTPHLRVLLDRARSGASTQDVKAYLDAGGSPVALVQARSTEEILPLLHSMMYLSPHPHRELTEIVRLFVAAGVDINASVAAPHDHDFTALMRAVHRNCCASLPEALLRAGADPCVRNTGSSTTALHIAAAARQTECCDLLLSTQADEQLNLKDVNGWTPLRHAAARGGCPATVEVVLQHGADINDLDNDGKTVLMSACLEKQVGAVTCLLQAGADVNAVHTIKGTALTAAAQTDSTALVQLLLDHGANLHATDQQGQHALIKAAYFGHVPVMDLLVKRGLSVHSTGKLGQTVLMMAASKGQIAAAEWLLQHGVAVNAADIQQGYTALHGVSSSSVRDDAAMIELLLANGADVHKKAKHQQLTALDMAALHGNVNCARALIAAGANVNAADYTGITCLHMALTQKHAAVVRLLLEHGATDVMNRAIPIQCMINGARCCNNSNALMLCTTVDTVKALLAAGADVHATNDVGDTCLHAAAKHKFEAAAMCLLIKAGVNLHALNYEGKTAAQIARERGHALTEQLLIRAAQQA